MRGLESPRALLAFLSIGLSWLAAGRERSPSEPVRPKAVQLTRTIPLVVLDLETDPVASGLAASSA